LDAWEPFGARAEYGAAIAAAAAKAEAEARAAAASTSTSQQAAALNGGATDAEATVVACNGLPMAATATGEFLPVAACSEGVAWRGTEYEQRLVAGVTR
jgi:hypothetical protein